MKEMTTKEITLLGKDLRMAKILVLNKHGFTPKEIATVIGISESMVRKLIASAENGIEE